MSLRTSYLRIIYNKILTFKKFKDINQNIL